MNQTFLAVVAALAAFSPGAVAQTDQSLIGTWKLVSSKTTTVSGNESTALYGQHPAGFITYTREGRMSAIITADGRKPLSVADRIAAPAEERAEAVRHLDRVRGTLLGLR
jgi:hypothetical protein